MVFLIHCLFAVVAFSVIAVRGNIVGPQYSLGIKISSTRSSRSQPVCTKAGMECTPDCSTLMLCSTSKTLIQHSVCTAPNRYCVNGACTSDSGTNCPNSPGGGSGSAFPCTDVGVFPDPDDCTQYHDCRDDGTAEDYQCPPGFVFNSQLSVCQIGRTPCTKISCAKATTANPIVLYTSNPAYYAFCMKNTDGVFVATMFKCPYEQSEVFDLKTNRCQLKCKARGNFQNPADCREYFYCSGANAQPIISACPGNWVFDGTGCNRDESKCQFTPTTTTTTTTTTPDPLHDKENADAPTNTLISGLRSDILNKICVVDSTVATDTTICPPPATLSLVTNHYKLEKDEDNIFVSVTIDTKDKHYHVKISRDSASGTPTPSVLAVKTASNEDEILYFA